MDKIKRFFKKLKNVFVEILFAESNCSCSAEKELKEIYKENHTEKGVKK